ncbi:hypothetical protein GQX74_002790 [Glossina fuscipes]|nr:hypothetical protein GQX74_002790 [Glossina fuscipes]
MHAYNRQDHDMDSRTKAYHEYGIVSKRESEREGEKVMRVSRGERDDDLVRVWVFLKTRRKANSRLNFGYQTPLVCNKLYIVLTFVFIDATSPLVQFFLHIPLISIIPLQYCITYCNALKKISL